MTAALLILSDVLTRWMTLFNLLLLLLLQKKKKKEKKKKKKKALEDDMTPKVNKCVKLKSKLQ